MMVFSARLPESMDESPFFKALSKLKKKCPYDDLTVSSPLMVGMDVDLKGASADSFDNWGKYEPSAAGRDFARKAVCEYYAERGGTFEKDDIWLTAGTSEAYSILFKTFCDPGDVILTPVPGYPLLDTLARLEELSCYPYFLKRNAKENRFVLDVDSLLSAPEKAKILLLVSPHNPTGHCVDEVEWNAVIQFCEENKLVLVVDEVFGDYTFEPWVKRTWQFDCGNVPVFWLNGFSKTVGAPQLKLGWMASHVPAENRLNIQRMLDFVADAYLSVSSIPESMSVPLLEKSKMYQIKLLERLKMNCQILHLNFPSAPQIIGGWYAPIHFPGQEDETFTLRLLEETHILVQPGFFFDFDEDGWIVVSLLEDPTVFARAMKTIRSF